MTAAPKHVRMRTTHPLEKKVEALRRLDNGEDIAAVANALNMNINTLRSVKRNKERIHSSVMKSMPLATNRSGLQALKKRKLLSNHRTNFQEHKAAKKQIYRKQPLNNSPLKSPHKKMQHPMEKKLEALRLLNDGENCRAVADAMGLHISTVYNFKRDKEKILRNSVTHSMPIANSLTDPQGLGTREHLDHQHMNCQKDKATVEQETRSTDVQTQRELAEIVRAAYLQSIAPLVAHVQIGGPRVVITDEVAKSVQCSPQSKERRVHSPVRKEGDPDLPTASPLHMDDDCDDVSLPSCDVSSNQEFATEEVCIQENNRKSNEICEVFSEVETNAEMNPEFDKKELNKHVADDSSLSSDIRTVRSELDSQLQGHTNINVGEVADVTSSSLNQSFDNHISQTPNPLQFVDVEMKIEQDEGARMDEEPRAVNHLNECESEELMISSVYTLDPKESLHVTLSEPNTGNRESIQNLTKRLLYLNNKLNDCDEKVLEIRKQYEEAIAVINQEKKEIENELDQVVENIQNWRQNSKRALSNKQL